MKTASFRTFTEKENDKRAIQKLLVIAFLSALAMFLPFLIRDGGRFTLISDFNFQQIPFNMHANWALKNGQIGWDWYTDLGVNFIGAFSFYNLGSPFFWLSLLFPGEAFPYLTGWFYILKYVAAAFFSFLWIRRHVKDPDYAVIGAMLYAFSGFSHINLQFYHFHEVIAFFPLLLLSLDRLVLEGRKGCFALAVAFMALVNYFFFSGQVLFLILYFFTVYRFKNPKERRAVFLSVLLEGILGVLGASVLLIPSALFIIYSPKTGSMLSLGEFFLFQKERYLTILKAMVFPAEGMPVQSSIFLFDYSSSAIYLPALGLSMAFAGIRGSRYRRLLALLALFALVPFLNASFTLFNSLYYARWFYMPALLLCAVSAEALEKAKSRAKQRGIAISLTLTLAFMAVLFFMDSKNRVYFVEPLFILSSFIALSGLILTLLILRWSSRKDAQDRIGRRTARQLLALVTFFSVLTGVYSISLTRIHDPSETQAFAEGYLHRTAKLKLGREDEEDYRFYTAEPAWNLSLLNRVPSVNSFITTNSPATYEFFKAAGIRHIPTSLFPDEVQDILTFLSVRYRLDKKPFTDWVPLYSKDNGHEIIHVSENPHFIPLGFPLDSFIYKDELMRYPEEERTRILIEAMVIPEGKDPPEHLHPFAGPASLKPLAEVADKKRAQAAQNFGRDSRGFSADVSAGEETTYLFTVPGEKGWSARVDGKSVPFERSLGFLSIHVPPGQHHIEFSYRIPGLLPGIFLSVLGFGLIFLRMRRK